MKIEELRKNAKLSIRINQKIKMELKTRGISPQSLFDSYLQKEIESWKVQIIPSDRKGVK